MVKPDLQIYQWVIAELGVDASQAVFVDDFVQNIEGANAAGMKTIHFQSPDQALQELRSLLE
jgi:HAD superfamily hydrolase (TIGR01509 family)